MPSGSCLCGAIQISYTGEPVYRAFCHCLDCRKRSSFPIFQIPKDNLTTTDPSRALKTFTKTSDVGHELSTHFCGSCGTSMYCTGGPPKFKDLVGLRAGVLDGEDASLVARMECKPMAEVFCDRRPTWMHKVEGAAQMNSKYEIVEGKLEVPGINA